MHERCLVTLTGRTLIESTSRTTIFHDIEQGRRSAATPQHDSTTQHHICLLPPIPPGCGLSLAGCPSSFCHATEIPRLPVQPLTNDDTGTPFCAEKFNGPKCRGNTRPRANTSASCLPPLRWPYTCVHPREIVGAKVPASFAGSHPSRDTRSSCRLSYHSSPKACEAELLLSGPGQPHHESTSSLC